MKEPHEVSYLDMQISLARFSTTETIMVPAVSISSSKASFEGTLFVLGTFVFETRRIFTPFADPRLLGLRAGPGVCVEVAADSKIPLSRRNDDDDDDDEEEDILFLIGQVMVIALDEKKCISCATPKTARSLRFFHHDCKDP